MIHIINKNSKRLFVLKAFASYGVYITKIIRKCHLNNLAFTKVVCIIIHIINILIVNSSVVVYSIHMIIHALKLNVCLLEYELSYALTAVTVNKLDCV